MNLSRRRFLQSSTALFAAPAIVSNVMPLWVPPEPKWHHLFYQDIDGVQRAFIDGVEISPSILAAELPDAAVVDIGDWVIYNEKEQEFWAKVSHHGWDYLRVYTA